MKRQAQSIVEFVFVIPLVIIIVFGAIEYGMFYRNVSVVNDIAKEAAIKASRATVVSTQTAGLVLYTDPATGCNAAVIAVFNSVWKKLGQLGLKTNTGWAMGNNWGKLIPPQPIPVWGNPPYALYEIDSLGDTNCSNSSGCKFINGNKTPTLTIWVDYRDPESQGVSVQVLYWYRPILFGGIALPMPGSAPITMIPRDIPISSPNVTEPVSY